ncbi:acylphosphatase [Candidatus Magnetomonas plexicatena]|uniref:acylphosphatase n=1 Tax=Candidatus Magnetomonas plexicatena TaxID=2552947 RepID=UPI004033064A
MTQKRNKRAHLTIEGRVQGVCFRAFTAETARREGVRGWVRNLDSGDVEAVFEGTESAVSKVVAACYKGPPGALVTNVKLKWPEYKGEFETFSIRY